MNRLKRLVKTPKLHLGDTGIAASLLGAAGSDLLAERTLFGQLLETFVYAELRKLGSCSDVPVRIYHSRDHHSVEVDLVLERGRRAAGIEVKASATVTSRDLRGLRRLKEAAGARFAGGAVLYEGETCAPFGDGLWAVPIRRLWETV